MQNRESGSLVCGNKQFRNRACRVVSSRKPKIAARSLPPLHFWKKSGGRGCWPGQISVNEWLPFSLNYTAAGGSIHCLSFFYAQNFWKNRTSVAAAPPDQKPDACGKTGAIAHREWVLSSVWCREHNRPYHHRGRGYPFAPARSSTGLKIPAS